MTDTPMAPEYEREIRSHVAEMSNYSLGNLFARDLLAEVDRLRKALSDAADQVAGLDDELGKASAHTHFLERSTLPDLRRQIEHHKDGKARWRKRAEAAEARPVEAHVLRGAATALEDDHPDAAAVVLEMANKAERAAAARPWASSAQQPSKSRVVLSDHDLSRVEFARTKHAELNGHSGDYAERFGSMSALAEILLEVIDRAEVGGTP